MFTYTLYTYIYIIYIYISCTYTLYIIIQLYMVSLSVLALFEQREGLPLPSPQERWGKLVGWRLSNNLNSFGAQIPISLSHKAYLTDVGYWPWKDASCNITSELAVIPNWLSPIYLTDTWSFFTSAVWRKNTCRPTQVSSAAEDIEVPNGTRSHRYSWMVLTHPHIGFPSMGVPQNRWLIYVDFMKHRMENWWFWGYHHFRKPPYQGS